MVAVVFFLFHATMQLWSTAKGTTGFAGGKKLGPLRDKQPNSPNKCTFGFGVENCVWHATCNYSEIRCRLFSQRIVSHFYARFRWGLPVALAMVASPKNASCFLDCAVALTPLPTRPMLMRRVQPRFLFSCAPIPAGNMQCLVRTNLLKEVQIWNVPAKTSTVLSEFVVSPCHWFFPRPSVLYNTCERSYPTRIMFEPKGLPGWTYNHDGPKPSRLLATPPDPSWPVTLKD